MNIYIYVCVSLYIARCFSLLLFICLQRSIRIYIRDTIILSRSQMKILTMNRNVSE